jgi:predicted RNase H-like HicB family nuclease
MRYVVILEKGASSFGAYVPDLLGYAVVGETREEALQLIRSSMREHGDPVREPSSITEHGLLITDD